MGEINKFVGAILELPHLYTEIVGIQNFEPLQFFSWLKHPVAIDLQYTTGGLKPSSMFYNETHLLYLYNI